MLELVLHMLRALLAASRSHLSQHQLEHPVIPGGGDKGGGIAADTDREELRLALVAAQESAAVQILLECCLPTDREKVSFPFLCWVT